MIYFDEHMAILTMSIDEWREISATVIEDLAVAVEYFQADTPERMPYRTASLLALIKHFGGQIYLPEIPSRVARALIDCADDCADE